MKHAPADNFELRLRRTTDMVLRKSSCTRSVPFTVGSRSCRKVKVEFRRKTEYLHLQIDMKNLNLKNFSLVASGILFLNIADSWDFNMLPLEVHVN